jgi:hypothetical protein
MHNKHISRDNYELSSRNTHEKLMNFQDAKAKARKKTTNFVTTHPQTTQYCPLLVPPNQTSQEVTHPGITLAKARLAAEF